jgi:hypothetical protein
MTTRDPGRVWRLPSPQLVESSERGLGVERWRVGAQDGG